MTPSAPANEDRLQKLIADYPEILGFGEGELLLIKREQSIGERWSLDHLFVSRDAVPVLVEVKRATDTRLRREVVGQMMDYAANAIRVWSSGTLAQNFAHTNGDKADDILDEFLGPEQEADQFWQQVDANFKIGRVKLLFVADEIPTELARIIEFLNEQMTADVLGVSLSYFEGKDGSLNLAPQIIGQTALAKVTKERGNRPPINDSLPKIIQRFNQFDTGLTCSSAGHRTFAQIRFGNRHIHYEWLIKATENTLNCAVHFESKNQQENVARAEKIGHDIREIAKSIDRPATVGAWGRQWATAHISLSLTEVDTPEGVELAATTMKKIVQKTLPILRQYE